MNELTHFDDQGRARMVDVSEKNETGREAIAQGEIKVSRKTLDLIQAGQMAKGDVLGVAQIAGIMGAKSTSNLIPMCHPLMLTGAKVNFKMDIENNRVLIEARVKITGKTGVEMEALSAVSIAALTIYDMCKAIDKDMVIGNIRLVEKIGGKSGHYKREGEDSWES